jgi:nucleotide-binding universal stress UspA family protein
MKVLIAVDGSDYSRMAIEFIASRRTLLESNPDLEVLHVRLPVPANPARVVGNKVVRAYYAEEAEKILKPARVRLLKAGFSPKVRYAIGHPATEIGTTAEKNKADLVVLGSHGHTALAGMLFGSVTNEVLVRTKRAMLIVRGKAKSYPDSLRVGIAVDGSRYGREAAKYVLRHLELFGINPKLTLIHVLYDYSLAALPNMLAIAQPALSQDEVRALQKKAFEGAIEPVQKLLKKRTDLDTDEVRLIGNAGVELSAYANRKLDLLVLGSHGYGAFKAVMMGSVATRVTAHSRVPLLLVRA